MFERCTRSFFEPEEGLCTHVWYHACVSVVECDTKDVMLGGGQTLLHTVVKKILEIRIRVHRERLRFVPKNVNCYFKSSTVELSI